MYHPVVKKASSMDVGPIVSTLSTVRQQFAEASHRWPQLSHALVIFLDTQLGRAHGLGPPRLSHRQPPHSEAYGLIDGETQFIRDVDGSIRQETTFAVSAHSQFHFSDAAIQTAASAIDRFRDLAAIAWPAALQLPEPTWTILNPPLKENLGTLVGRSWLGPHRVYFDRDKVLAQLTQQAIDGVNHNYDPDQVVPPSGYRLRGFRDVTQPHVLWLLAVYNIGWKASTLGPFRLERSTWESTTNFTFRAIEADLDAFDGRAFAIMPSNCPRPIEWFCSEMSDPFLKSALTIDLLLRRIEEANRSESSGVARTVAEAKVPATATLSVVELARLLDVDQEPLRKRLERWRAKNLDGGWIQAADTRVRQPQYLYPFHIAAAYATDIKKRLRGQQGSPT